jgi:hypothetical protein
MSTPRIKPFPAFAAPVVRIVASPIKFGWRYRVMPAGRGKVVSYSLGSARATARRYSRKVLEEGPRAAFDGRGRR